jgi:hypothetical protein
MTTRVSTDDLLFAATWMEAYEGSEERGEDENVPAAQRLAKYFRELAAERETRAAVTDLVRRTGASRERARAALARQMARQEDAR